MELRVPFIHWELVLVVVCRRLRLSSQSVDKEILDVLPKIKEAKNIVGLMDRDTLTFDVALQRTEDEVRYTPDVSLLLDYLSRSSCQIVDRQQHRYFPG